MQSINAVNGSERVNLIKAQVGYQFYVSTQRKRKTNFNEF